MRLLEELSKDSTASQRKLSNHLDMALGVTNACLKKMISKGYIKVKGVNHRRIAYYLTPTGFAEKTRLTYHFLQHTLHYYINLKNNISSKLDLITRSGASRILYYGAGEVMEVAVICLSGTNLELVGIVDDSNAKQGKKMLNFVIESPEIIKKAGPDAVLVTSIRYKDKILDKLKRNRELKGIDFYLI